jgi:hypothetical protein
MGQRAASKHIEQFNKTMSVSTREKNILMLAGLVAIIFIGNSILPAIGSIYNEREKNIESIQLDIARERRLIEDTLRWRELRIESQAEQTELEQQVFSGDTIPIIEANIQRELSRHARDSDITVSSTRLAELLSSDGWLLISQEMSFRTNNAGNTVSFLRKLEDSQPRLRVTDFSVNRSRNQYSGSITVVGFARSDDLPAEKVASR